MKGLGGGFLGLGNTFRAMTAAPQIQAAVDLAHRFARQRLETGGPAGLKRKSTAVRAGVTEFVLLTDIDPVAFAQAVRAKLGNGDAVDVLYPLERKKLGGRVVLRGRHILRLGDGRYDKGRAFLHAVLKDLRARHWRARFP